MLPTHPLGIETLELLQKDCKRASRIQDFGPICYEQNALVARKKLWWCSVTLSPAR
jgi:hypothetical protein